MPLTVTLTPDLRRAAEYRVGHALTDREALAVIEAELDATLTRLAVLGRWIERIGAWKPRVRLRGQRHGWHSPRDRTKQSVAMRASWARRKRQRAEQR